MRLPPAAAVPRASVWRGVGRVLCCAATGCTVGIDLGTTNSAVALLRDGVPVMVPNGNGNLTTPSVVAYTDDGVIVGDDALSQARSNVGNTLHSFKRFLGRSLNQVERDAEAVGFNVVGGEDGGVAFVCPASPEPVAPEEASAAMLRQLVADAEKFAGTAVTSAVITVPAYFTEKQRAATRVAAALAGLDRVALLSEPVAACLAYGLSGAVGTVLVFDLGAGTFDVRAPPALPAPPAFPPHQPSRPTSLPAAQEAEPQLPCARSFLAPPAARLHGGAA